MADTRSTDTLRPFVSVHDYPPMEAKFKHHRVDSRFCRPSALTIKIPHLQVLRENTLMSTFELCYYELILGYLSMSTASATPCTGTTHLVAV